MATVMRVSYFIYGTGAFLLWTVVPEQLFQITISRNKELLLSFIYGLAVSLYPWVYSERKTIILICLLPVVFMLLIVILVAITLGGLF